MSPRKRRVFQHIMEDQSLMVFKQKIPKEWAIHEYKPDYGIDFVVEIFEYVDKDEEVAETLGDLFFVQLKSSRETQIETIKIFPRGNVEKAPLKDDKSEHFLIDVIKYNLDTSELLTVQSMGYSIPVLLILVALDLDRVFFVCLNDLIDKVILPQDPNFDTKKSKTIYIPIKNEIGIYLAESNPLQFYAKRAKLFSAFIKFQYQLNELQYFLDGKDDVTVTDKNLIEHFIRLIKRFDFWENTREWEPIESCYKEVLDLEQMLCSLGIGTFKHKVQILNCWRNLTNLSNMYEELCREWFLPTFLSQLLSYSDTPEPIEGP